MKKAETRENDDGDCSIDTHSQLFNGMSTMHRLDTEMNTNRHEASTIIDSEIKQALYGNCYADVERQSSKPNSKMQGFVLKSITP
jgi:hypothetical protein